MDRDSRIGRLGILRKAVSGDAEAMKAIARVALPTYRKKYEALEAELDRHRTEEWDVEGMREWALDPETEVHQETFRQAWGELHTSLLKIATSTAPILAGDQRESKLFEEQLREAAFELFLRANNPVHRYTIVAGFEPRLREEVDEWVGRLGREAWGTLEALVQDELHVDNYPPESAEVIRTIASDIDPDVGDD